MKGFLSNGGKSVRRPADLAYVMEFRIARACDEQATSEALASEALLARRDPETIPRERRYAKPLRSGDRSSAAAAPCPARPSTIFPACDASS